MKRARTGELQHFLKRTTVLLWASMPTRAAALAQGHHVQAMQKHTHRHMTTKYDFDLFAIGGGTGGVRAARLSASIGKSPSSPLLAPKGTLAKSS